MKTLVSLFKRTKYIIWAVLAVVIGVVVLVVRGFFGGGRKEGTGRLPEVPEKLKAKVAKVEEDALVARVEARVGAEKAKEELDRAGTMDDGAERRKYLAGVIRASKR
jgi:hypothetical protein